MFFNKDSCPRRLFLTGLLFSFTAVIGNLSPADADDKKPTMCRAELKEQFIKLHTEFQALSDVYEDKKITKSTLIEKEKISIFRKLVSNYEQRYRFID